MKAAQVKTQVPPKAAPQAEQVRCADGINLLLHPYTQQSFTQSPTEFELDGWVQSQLDAGKLVKC